MQGVGPASSVRIFRGTALPGGVFVLQTAVGHRAEAQKPGATKSGPR